MFTNMQRILGAPITGLIVFTAVFVLPKVIYDAYLIISRIYGN